ncbi:MAG: aconitate hydratase [Deltaproteobacteria bacterium]|nr:aconitate hydratase [Deltaproteobacteria bacterium]
MEVLNKQETLKLLTDYVNKVDSLRALLRRPLTLTEKILFAHLADPSPADVVRGLTPLELKPDRVVMQDVTAQMAMLEFMTSGRDTVCVPASIHCDHLIRAQEGAEKDLLRALDENKEVFDFLESSALKHGIDFWGPGAGIIHQVVLEKYAIPANLIIGTDSHTPNAGGLGALAVGVGGAEAAEVMAGLNWILTAPKILGIRLVGSLNPWLSGKDVILKVASLLTVKGGTGKILEYFGPGLKSLSLTGRATITNMGAELGATTSIFPVDERTFRYLNLTERSFITDFIQDKLAFFQADKEVLDNPESFFDEVIEIDLSSLKPGWVGPHTPDLYHSVEEMREFLAQNDIPTEIRYALIGSCTNSSYEDLSRSASLAKQALEHGLKVKIPLLVTPGSDQILRTVERDGFLDIFKAVGATVLANACGPCIGQWSRSDIRKGEKNVIVTSYNRNFRKRNDGNEETMAFISSPELVTAIAFYGRLDANPLSDEIIVNGSSFKFLPPIGKELPENGFSISYNGFKRASEKERKSITVIISPDSERLALLPVFPAPKSEDFLNLIVLFKAVGKCTTDHISPAGSWLKYRGHLDKISDNLLLGATNEFTNEIGKTLDFFSKETKTPAEVARKYKELGKGWVIIGEENYGEGSSREHAAMTPRYLNCKAVIVKSFARIHETNLKKHGVLPLTFENPNDYLLFTVDTVIDIHVNPEELEPGEKVRATVRNDGRQTEITLLHSFTKKELDWFRKGSALNIFRTS